MTITTTETITRITLTRHASEAYVAALKAVTLAVGKVDGSQSVAVFTDGTFPRTDSLIPVWDELDTTVTLSVNPLFLGDAGKAASLTAAHKATPVTARQASANKPFLFHPLELAAGIVSADFLLMPVKITS
jgi:hypothetical protein